MVQDSGSRLTRGLGLTALLVLAWTAGSSAYDDPATAPAKSLRLVPHRVETTTAESALGSSPTAGAEANATSESAGEAVGVEGEAVPPAEAGYEAEYEAEYEEEDEEEDEDAPKSWTPGFEEHAGFGVCIGKGAGLAGFYGYLRPSDLLGLEFELGVRTVALTLQDHYGTHTNFYWPLAGAAKLQFFFQDRSARYQSGLALGVLMAQDAGVGGSVAYFSHLHLTGHLYLDWEVGLGTFPDIQKNLEDYLEQAVGPGYIFDVKSTPAFLMWGIGLSLAI